MIRHQHKQTLLAASLFSWALLFVLPFLNGQLNNGAEWVKLCTHTGIQYITIESPDTASISSWQGLDCPCLDNSLPQFVQLLSLHTLHSNSASVPLVGVYPPSAAYFLPPLRAPPTV